jgi:hypothetical protein
MAQNPFDRFRALPAMGSYCAVRQNHRHLCSPRFIGICGELGRTGAAWFLSGKQAFAVLQAICFKREPSNPSTSAPEGIDQGKVSFGSNLVALARPREIRTLRNPRCKLRLCHLMFSNYTKMTKYEALEKNAVSEPKMLQLGNLQYSRCSRKASVYWGIFGLFIDGEIG